MKKIIIIGAGIAGLSAGCYGQMNGYETEIFEMHDISGGLCTSWSRKGYNIDGCMDFLTGTNPETNFYKMWEELGAVENRSFAFHREITRINRNGKEFILYSDIDKLEEHMLETAPEDEKAIRELLSDARKIAKFNPPVDKFTTTEKVKMALDIMPYAKIFSKYRMSVREFSKRFKNQFLRDALTLLYSPEFPAIVAVISIGNYSRKNSGFPIGGSLKFAKAIERRYLNLGGKINFKSKAQRILIKNDRAVGVMLSDGRVFEGDMVISASDVYNTVNRLLEGRYSDEKIKKAFEENTPMTPYVRVYLGVDEDLSSMPHTQVLFLNKEVEIAGVKRNRISLHNYCYDKTLSPEGKSLLRVTLDTTYEYWNNLYWNPEAYRMVKNAVAEAAIDVLDEIIVGIKDKIEMVDVVTPKTYERYTGNFQGSFMGWFPTPKTMSLRLPMTLEGLRNFYMAGQWLESLGGIPTAAMTGRDAIKLICKNDKKKFTLMP